MTIDLNGFQIRPSGARARGIFAGSGVVRVVVRNGRVSGNGTGANGISLNDDSQIEDVIALDNGAAGILCGNRCNIGEVTANLNQIGVVCADACVITNAAANNETNNGTPAATTV